MKRITKNRILLCLALFGVSVFSQACTAGGTPAQPQPSPPAASPSPLPSPQPASPSPSPPASPTPTVLTTTAPTALPPTRLPPSAAPPPSATPTSSPFLPPDLAPISPQNAANLKPVAKLAEQGAGVVAYSPDSLRLAVGLFRDNLVKIWDLASGQELFSLGGHERPRILSYLAFSPDGAQLASGAQGWEAEDDSLILWDLASGRQIERFDGVLGALSPDWRLVALTRREQEQDTVLVLSDLASDEQLHSLPADSDIYGISFSPDGQQVAGKMLDVFQDLFSFWSVESGRLERTLYDWVGFAYSPDGRYIAALVDTGSGDQGELNIFAAPTFKWFKTLAKDADNLWYAYPAFSADGQLLAASFGDQVVVWETQHWQKLAALRTNGPAGSAFSPDGRLLATYTLHGPVQLWGVAGGP